MFGQDLKDGNGEKSSERGDSTSCPRGFVWFCEEHPPHLAPKK